jgi:hypothetical protein
VGGNSNAGNLVYSAHTCYHNLHKGGGDIHAPSKIRTHDLSVEAVQDRKHPESRVNARSADTRRGNVQPWQMDSMQRSNRQSTTVTGIFIFGSSQDK